MVRDMALAAKEAQPALGTAPAAERSAALEHIANALEERAAGILTANQEDVAAASHLSEPVLSRLQLDAVRLKGIVKGVRAVAAAQDILGEPMAEWTLPNGLKIAQVRVPLGVIGMIYESRPGVTVDAAAICLKAGNAVLLRGGREAQRTNAMLGEAIGNGLARAGFSPALAQVLPSTREAASALMTATGLVDVLIPRGGAGLIQAVLEQSRVPVIETGTGVCHIYVHSEAELAQAEAIVLNAKCSSPAVCNAAETLLVDSAIALRFLPTMGIALQQAGVHLRGCDVTREILPWVEAATDEDWSTEYLNLTLAVRVVDGLDEALAHIARFGTRHSESIVTRSIEVAERFLNTIDAAVVYHNASTRFTDGGEFGFGAEIGISTQKLHARGPMGFAAVTSYKYLVRGAGQVRV